MSDASVIAQQTGSVGHLLLNRPKALNALNLEMVELMHKTLEMWVDDNAVQAVVVSGAGDKSFCAGGDVKSVYYAGLEGGRSAGSLTSDFFRAEYTLNYLIANFPKPYIAYIDGITMGGGVGVSIMGSHRIATERTVFAMPETGIGLFPDVGGSHFMSRAGNLGLLLALTGRPLRGREVVEGGFATHYIDRMSDSDLLSLIDTLGIEQTMEKIAVKNAATHDLDGLQQLAAICFSHGSVEEILQSLEVVAAKGNELSKLATETLDVLKKRSPTSLKVTMEQLSRGRTLDFKDCLKMEYRLSQACMAGHDFYEGIRAVLVDKDHSPKWSPAGLSDVDHVLVEKHFAHLGESELVL